MVVGGGGSLPKTMSHAIWWWRSLPKTMSQIWWGGSLPKTMSQIWWGSHYLKRCLKYGGGGGHYLKRCLKYGGGGHYLKRYKQNSTFQAWKTLRREVTEGLRSKRQILLSGIERSCTFVSFLLHYRNWQR